MYDVELRARAEKDLAALPTSVARRAIAVITSLKETPRPSGVRKLQVQDAHRIRLGDYRIIFEIDDRRQQVTVVRSRQRRDVSSSLR